MAMPAALVIACCSAMPTSNTRSGKARANAPRPVGWSIAAVIATTSRGPRADREELVAEPLRPGPPRRCGRGGSDVNGRARGHLVQAVFLVLLGERVAEPLPGDHVHQDRAAEVRGPAQRVLDHLLVMAVDGPEVLEAEVLEEHLRLQHVLDALLDPVQRVVERRPRQRRVGARGAVLVADRPLA